MSKWHRIYVHAGGVDSLPKDRTRLSYDDLDYIVSIAKGRAKWRIVQNSLCYWGYTAVVKFKDKRDVFWFQMKYSAHIDDSFIQAGENI